MIELAGGQPITTGSTTSFEIPLETLVTADPEVILLGDAAYGVTADAVAARPGWNVMTAVKDGQIRPVDDVVITRPGPVSSRASGCSPSRSIPTRTSRARRHRPNRRPRLGIGRAVAEVPTMTTDGALASRRPTVAWIGRARRRPILLGVGGLVALGSRWCSASGWAPSRSRRPTRSASSPSGCSGSTSIGLGRPRRRRSSGTSACRGSSPRWWSGPGSRSPGPRSRACCATRSPIRTCWGPRPGRRSGRRSPSSSRSAWRSSASG